MKTIKQVADICGVSKTTIENRIKKLNIEKVYSNDNRRTVVISEADAQRIIEDIEPPYQTANQPPTDHQEPPRTANNHKDTANQPPTDEAARLIEVLTKENENKQRIIDALLQDKELMNAQLMLLQTQIAELKALPPVQEDTKPEEPEPQTEKKTGIKDKLLSFIRR